MTGAALAAAVPQAAPFAASADDVFAAARALEGHVTRTPTLFSPKLSELTGAQVYVKYENFQATGSFKDRGALLKLLSLSEAERRRGVVTMSAGNHAQALAWHSRRLGVEATIVMPATTPFVKVGNTEALGARVILHGSMISESQEMALELASHGPTLVHPYDDPRIIAGQGTAAVEMLADANGLDCLVIPIGGGGLAAGMALAAKALRPDIELIGVETALYPSAHALIKGGEAACGGQTLAEGIAVKNIGANNAPILRALFSDVMLLPEALIERAIFLFLSLQKTVAEGAGAITLAALLAEPERFRGRRVGLVMTGGNIDPRILASITFRGLERERKIISLRLAIPDEPGMLGRIATCLGEAGANILDVSHRRMFLDMPAKGTTLDLMIETKGVAHARDVVSRLRAEGYSPVALDSPGGREIAHEDGAA